MPRSPLIWLVLASLGLSLTVSPPARAGVMRSTGANDQSVTSQWNRERTPSGWQTQRQTTFPLGQTSSTTVRFSGDRNGSYTGTVTHTNRQGNSRTYEVEGQFSRGNGSYTNSGTVTGSNGNQATFNNRGSMSNGQFKGERTLTMPNGQTRLVEFEGERTAPGRSEGRMSVTNERGQTRSGSFQRRR